MSIDLLIIRNWVRLERMIKEDEEYSKILRQSKKLDKLINAKMMCSCVSNLLIFAKAKPSHILYNVDKKIIEKYNKMDKYKNRNYTKITPNR